MINVFRLPEGGIALIAALVLTALPGCASKDSIIPQSDISMREIYTQHMGKTQSTLQRESRQGCPENLTAWTREQRTEHQSKFPRLHNPDLTLYVFPHMSDSGAPIPAYTTVFPMYDQVEYSLPGEETGGSGC